MTVVWRAGYITCLGSDSKPTEHPNGDGALFGDGWRAFETDTQTWYTYTEANGWEDDMAATKALLERQNELTAELLRRIGLLLDLEPELEGWDDESELIADENENSEGDQYVS